MASTPYAVSVSQALAPDIIPITIPVFAASAITNADELTDYIPGFNFEVVAIQFVCVTAITTGSKTVTINPYIDAVIVPGTATAVAGTKAKGVVSTAWTATPGTKLYGSATSKLKLTCSSVTAFTEGAGYWVVQIRNIGNLA